MSARSEHIECLGFNAFGRFFDFVFLYSVTNLDAYI